MLLGQVVGVLDQLGHCGVVTQCRIVFGHSGDGAVQQPQRVGVEVRVLGYPSLAGLLVDHQPPHPLQEPVRPDDVLGGPRA